MRTFSKVKPDPKTIAEPIPAEFRPIDENTSQTTDMLLDWLCWDGDERAGRARR
jgi:hypothetical protein